MLNKSKVTRIGSVGAALAPFSAMAALPDGAETAFTTLQTDALALVDLAWPAVIAVTVAFIIIKMFKKAAGKV